MNENITENPSPIPKRRSTGIDIVKVFAAFLVIVVHFFYHTAFYTAIPITDTEFIPPLMLLWTAYTCVPLFMISTGYLMNSKKLSKKYYRSMIKVIVLYLICSTVCLLYKKSNGQVYDLWGILRGYLRYSHCDYAWYVEQYLVMLLIVPFLNMAFNGLQSKKHHIALLVTVIFLFSAAPSFYLGFDPDDQIKPFPEYMTNCYPIAYYYLGCFIKRYPPKKSLSNKLFSASLFFGAVLFLSLFTYSQSQGNAEQYFRSYHYFNYCSYPVFAASAGIFLLLFDIDIRNGIAAKLLSLLSETTLLTYMLSVIFDSKLYGEFNYKYPYPDFMLRYRHICEIVPKVYIYSLISAFAVLIVYKFGERTNRYLKKRRSNEISIQKTAV